MQEQGTIKSYCKENNISVRDFCKIVDMSEPFIYDLAKDPKINISIKKIQQIYNKTKESFPDNPLTPDMYLDYDVIK